MSNQQCDLPRRHFHSLFDVVSLLATCTRKSKVPGSSPAATYMQTRAVCSNRPANVCEAGGSGSEELKEDPPPPPAVL